MTTNKEQIENSGKCLFVETTTKLSSEDLLKAIADEHMTEEQVEQLKIDLGIFLEQRATAFKEWGTYLFYIAPILGVFLLELGDVIYNYIHKNIYNVIYKYIYNYI